MSSFLRYLKNVESKNLLHGRLNCTIQTNNTHTNSFRCIPSLFLVHFHISSYFCDTNVSRPSRQTWYVNWYVFVNSLSLIQIRCRQPPAGLAGHPLHRVRLSCGGSNSNTCSTIGRKENTFPCSAGLQGICRARSRRPLARASLPLAIVEASSILPYRK